MSGGAGLLRANALNVPLADRSVHLMVTSPPYFSLRSYRDDGKHFDGQIGSEATPTDFLLALWAVADEMWRVLDDGGSAWWNLGDKYAGSGGHNNATLGKVKGAGTKSGRATRRNGYDRYNQAADVRAKSLSGMPWRFMMGLIMPELYRAPFEPSACWHDDGPGPCSTCRPREFPKWIGRAEEIWSKPNGLPESVTDRPRRSHEQWFMVTKQPRYFAAVDEVREPQKFPDHGQIGKEHRSKQWREDGHRAQTGHGEFSPIRQLNPLGKLPGSVRSVPSEPLRVPDHLGVDHFAAFPSEWPRWIIAGWSPRGICTACGEGRRPVVKKDYDAQGRTTNGPQSTAQRHESPGREVRKVEMATITGYACACPDASAPTRPAVVLDPFVGTGTVSMMARVMGRYGVGIDLSRDYLRLARWRVFESGHGEKRLAKTEAERNPKPKRKPKVRRVDAPPAVVVPRPPSRGFEEALRLVSGSS